MEKVLDHIKLDLATIQKESEATINRNDRLNHFYEKTINSLFVVATIGLLIAIFSQPWIGVVSLIIAIAGCGLQAYRVRVNLSERTDFDYWILSRCYTLTVKCLELEKLPGYPTGCGSEIGFYKQVLEDIKEDRKAYQKRYITPSIDAYLEGRYQRNRYSAAMKNKYNNHGIKQYL